MLGAMPGVAARMMCSMVPVPHATKVHALMGRARAERLCGSLPGVVQSTYKADVSVNRNSCS